MFIKGEQEGNLCRDEIVMFLGCDDGYTNVCTCQNAEMHPRKDEFYNIYKVFFRFFKVIHQKTQEIDIVPSLNISLS